MTTDVNERGSILVVVRSELQDEVTRRFLQHSTEKDIDDDDTSHLFQCRENCTDENYRPPELSLVQISKLQLHTITFKKNGIFYTFSADILDIYGKGLTSETSFENLQYQVKINILCCKGGIYPLSSSDNYNQSLSEKFIANAPPIDDDNKEIITKKVLSIKVSLKDKSVRSFTKLIKKLIASNHESCTFDSLNEWIINGFPLLTDGYNFFIEFYNGKICWDETSLNDEGIRVIYFNTSKENLSKMINEITNCLPET